TCIIMLFFFLHTTSTKKLQTHLTQGTVTTLNHGKTLYAGQYIESRHFTYKAIMQTNGNFVIYCEKEKIWETRTSGTNLRLTLQSDGNLVIKDQNNITVWVSGSVRGNGTYKLTIQKDGNL